MSRTLSLLDQISIASPCPASWAEMKGDDKTRFCGQCNKNVYNLSAMTREEAEALIIAKEGKLCAQIYQRRDGTVLTADCPVGLRLARRAVAGMAGATAAMMGLIVTAASALGLPVPAETRLMRLDPFGRICKWLSPTPIRPKSPVLGRPLGGAISLPYFSPPNHYRPAILRTTGEVGQRKSPTIDMPPATQPHINTNRMKEDMQ